MEQCGGKRQLVIESVHTLLGNPQTLFNPASVVMVVALVGSGRMSRNQVN